MVVIFFPLNLRWNYEDYNCELKKSLDGFDRNLQGKVSEIQQVNKIN